MNDSFQPDEMSPAETDPGPSYYVERDRFRRKWRQESVLPPPSMSDQDRRVWRREVAWARRQLGRDPRWLWLLIWGYLPDERRREATEEQRDEAVDRAARRFGVPENPVVSSAALERILDEVQMEEVL